MDQATLERFHFTFARLLVLSVQQRLGVTENAAPFDEEDSRFLIEVASMLAFGHSDGGEIDAQWRQWAYDTATRLAQLKSSDVRYRKAAEAILARLGNFPTRDFLNEVLPVREEVGRLPVALGLEAIAREEENTIVFERLGQRVLTDFQVRMVQSLRNGQPLSISAPTSAGKSFIFMLQIVSALAENSARVIVYVVPTRALIRQVITDLLSHLRAAQLERVVVTGAPLPVDSVQVENGVVYVLTQERLMSLLSSSDEDASIDSLYIDEAQELGDEDRGMILHSAIEEALRRKPRLRVCFASPLTKNPGSLLDEFGIKGEAYRERQSPVGQALVTLDEVKGTPKAIQFSVATPIGLQSVGPLAVDFEFRRTKERLARTAILVTRPDETTIVYANIPSDAVEIAQRIADLVKDHGSDPALSDLVSFVRSHVHPLYALASTLPKRVAFHYGNMPHVVRSQVEDLVRRGIIKYVVATSTLLQGVNLPASNVVTFRPRTGKTNEMESPEFWNLAGRAGRLRRSFSGTIWCVMPSVWENNPLNGERLSEIKSSFRAALQSDTISRAIIAVLDGTLPLHKVTNKSRVEQVIAKVYSEYTCRDRKLSESRYSADVDSSRLRQIDEACGALRSRLQVPAVVCQRNSAVSPLNLDELWKRFGSGTPEQFIPLDPRSQGALPRYQEIFRIIDEIFLHTETERSKYFGALAWWWVAGQRLDKMIENHLQFNGVPSEPKAVNRAIREFLDGLENELRFRYVKYLKAYIDTLGEFVQAAQRTELLSRIAPLHVYIEYGARDSVAVMLMSLGLSRSTSLLIRDVVTAGSEISRDECWAKLKSLPLDLIDIPNVCKSEIFRLRGDAQG